MNLNSTHNSLLAAQKLDAQDELANLRAEFHFPKTDSNNPALYFAGHSLGLMPKKASLYVQEEMDDWKNYAVEGHFKTSYPWVPYHEFLAPMMAKLVGAKESEVVVMNTLTVNLHLLMVSFYRPTPERYKILIENNTFPSDKYAVDSQARFHGFDPDQAIIELKAEKNQMTVSEESLLQQIEENKNTLSLIILGNCNYLSGQCFPFEKIVKLAHQYGIKVGFNLAHGAGNLLLNLHDWQVDFALWCSYKYLNAGPGSLSGVFIHEKHLKDSSLPRFEGWWGTEKSTRFKMGPKFIPMPTAESWQLSNPPIFPLAIMRASLELFTQASMPKLIQKRDQLTGYLEFLLQENCPEMIQIQTPKERGAMLCVKIIGGNTEKTQNLVKHFHQKGVFMDFRMPDIIRITPAPLYNNFSDVFQLVQILKEELSA